MATLRTFFLREGERLKRLLRELLLRGRGYDGRVLPRKRYRSRRPGELGIDSSSGGVPGRMRSAPVRAADDGFTITFGLLKKDQVFQEGSSKQPARPYAGITSRRAERITRRLLNELVGEGRRLGVFR